MVARTYNSNTWESEAGELQWVWGQSELYSEFQDSLDSALNQMDPQKSTSSLTS